MRKTALFFALLLSALTARAQLKMDASGNLLMGSVTAPSSSQNRWYINDYGGLRWVWDGDQTISALRFLQIDMMKSDPCIFGGNSTSTGEVDFCTGASSWNTLMVRRTYTNSSGTVDGTIPQPLATLSSLRQVMDGDASSLAAPMSRFVSRKASVNDTIVTTVDYAGVVTLLTDAIQQLQGRLISMQAGMEALPSTTAKTATAAIETAEVLTAGTNAVTCAMPANAKECFMTLSTLDGNIVRKQMKAEKGSGQLTVDTDGLRAGTYICALFADGSIAETRYVVLTR